MMDSERDTAEKIRESLLKIEAEALQARHPWSRIFSPTPEIWEVLRRAKTNQPPFFSEDSAPSAATPAADASYAALANFCLQISGMDACSIQRASFPSPNRLLLETVKSFHTENGSARKYVLIPEGEGRKWSRAAELAGYRLVPIRLTGKEWMVPITRALERYGRDLAAFAFTFPNPSFAFPRDFPRFYETLHSLNILLVVDSRYSQSLLGQVNSRNLGLDLLLWDESTFTGDRFPPSQSLGIYLARGNLSQHLPRPHLSKREEDRVEWTNSPPGEGPLFPYGLPFHEARALLLLLERTGIESLSEKSGELALRRRYLREQIESQRPKAAESDTTTYFEPLPNESPPASSSTVRYAPYDFFAKVRGNESLDRLHSFLSPTPDRKRDKTASVTFAELHFSAGEKTLLNESKTT